VIRNVTLRTGGVTLTVEPVVGSVTFSHPTPPFDVSYVVSYRRELGG